jgi:concanavalin A-like lectin/glucanase superfamily protein
MKKHIIIFAAAITPLAFFSCSKEKMETQKGANSAQPQEIAFRFKPVINLDSGLVGRYEFDGNLKDYTGQLAAAVPNLSGYETYTDDRKGAPNSAIKFTGRYGLNISKVPLAAHMSVSVWARYDMLQSTNYFVTAQWLSPDFDQNNDTYWGIVNASSTSGVPSGSIDNQWHHLVATYDGTQLNFFVDGNFVGTTVDPTQSQIGPGATVDYQVGYITAFLGKTPLSTWFGSLDDLRFYDRILTAPEVKALYNL